MSDKSQRLYYSPQSPSPQEPSPQSQSPQSQSPQNRRAEFCIHLAPGAGCPPRREGIGTTRPPAKSRPEPCKRVMRITRGSSQLHPGGWRVGRPTWKTRETRKIPAMTGSDLLKQDAAPLMDVRPEFGLAMRAPTPAGFSLIPRVPDRNGWPGHPCVRAPWPAKAAVDLAAVGSNHPAGSGWWDRV